MSRVGEISLDLTINRKEFDNQIGGIQKLAVKTGKMLAAAFGVKKLVSFGKACIELGSDLQEVQNVVDVTFPAMQAKVNEFAQNAAASFGLSETMAKKFTGTFGAMAKAFGFAETEAYDMATTLTGLAGDVASFYNITQDEAYTKLKSVFTGETESLKDLGIVMTQTALDSYALANGFGKTTAKMTEAEKVALRYQFVQEQLTGAAGDFMRTSDGWANQVRVLSLQFDSLKATIGQGLINVLTPVLKLINTLIGKLMTLANAFKAFTEMVTGKKGTGDAAEQMSATAAAADSAAAATSAIGDAAASSAKKMRSLFSFDEMNVVSKDTESGSEATGTTGGYSAENIELGTVDTTALDTVDEKLQALFQRIQDGIKPTVTALKNLWKQGLSRLGKFTIDGLKDFYEHFLVPVGKWTLGEGIPRLVNALNDGLMRVDFEKINGSLERLWDAAAPFTEKVGEGLLWLWENVLVPFGTWTANNVVPGFIDMVAKALETANTIIEEAKPGFRFVWENFLKPLAEWTGELVIKALGDVTELLGKFGEWASEHQEIVATLGAAVASLAAGFGLANIVLGIWNVVCPIAEGVAYGLGVAIKFLTSPIGIATVIIGGLIAVGVLLYKNWDKIKEKAKELWDKLVEVFEGIKQNVTEKITAVKDVISCTIDIIKTSVHNKLETIKKIFAAAFGVIHATVTKIIYGTWEVIKKVINGIITGVETMANGIVKGLNKAIEALNKIQFDLPDWLPVVGGAHFGFNIPAIPEVSIPKLAAGGYVKANTPQLAMIGDNRHQGEIVAPEDKIYQVSAQAMRDVMQQFIAALTAVRGNGQSENVSIVLRVSGDMAALVRLLKVEMEKESNRRGVDFKVVYE